METLHIRFARKPVSLAEVKAVAENGSYRFERVQISETVNLSSQEYDVFTDGFLRDRSWLAGKGGAMNGVNQVIAVTAPQRTTLYVNPEGYDYARYVGIANNN